MIPSAHAQARDNIRIGMIHQPHFLPWLGYFARCISADVFVVLDNVKFNRNHFQQRTKYIDKNGSERWLGLPITRSTRSENISNVRIANSCNWTRWQQSLKNSYMHSQCFDRIWNDVYNIIKKESPVLLNVNVSTLRYLLNLLCSTIKKDCPEIILASQLRVSSERTQRLIDICLSKNITHLIMGEFALNKHDCTQIQESGISLLRHVYRGSSTKMPLAGITILHDLFLYDSNVIANQLCNAWCIEGI